MPRKSWRCFHCDEVFYCPSAAAEHFGATQDVTPACQVDVSRVREVEAQLTRYREEDTDLHRQLREKGGYHHLDVQRAEESGYAKGLRDRLRWRKASEHPTALTIVIFKGGNYAITQGIWWEGSATKPAGFYLQAGKDFFAAPWVEWWIPSPDNVA